MLIVGSKNRRVPTKNNILLQMLPIISPLYGVKPSVGAVLEILPEKIRNWKTEHVKM
jgi:hypothetical protein